MVDSRQIEVSLGKLTSGGRCLRQQLPYNNVSVCPSYSIDAFFILLSAFSDSLRHESAIPAIVGRGVLELEYLFFGINELPFVTYVGISLHRIGY